MADRAKRITRDITAETQGYTVKTGNKVGRPKKKIGEYKTINIAVPIELLEQIQMASKCKSMSMTEYVNDAIRQDLERNGKTYDAITKLQINF